MADTEAVSQTPRIVAGAVWVAALLLAPLPTVWAADAHLSDAERRGKEIYLAGSSPSAEPLIAVLGENRLRLPGRAVTCGGCHGHDGTGRPESGITPYNVTWKYLTKSYGHIHDSRLQHPPFTEQSLKHYLRTGIYPGGGKGDPSMPSYEVSDRDLDDLVAYLRRLGEDVDPGIGERHITIATVIPSTGPLAEIGGTIRDVLEAYFGEINGQGGLYGREIVLVVHELAPDPDSAPGILRTWLAAQQPFALISPFTPNMEAAVISAASDEQIPLIGPWTLYPVRTYSRNRYVFYLYSGLAEQVRALIGFAGARLAVEQPRVGLLYPDADSLAGVVDAIDAACRSEGWTLIEPEPFPTAAHDPDASVLKLREAGANLVISLAVESELRSFLESAVNRDWSPHVLAPGVLSGKLVVDAPERFDSRLYFAYPTLPQDRKPWAMREVAKLLTTRAQSHTQAAVSAYSAATVFEEALRKAGRDLGRRKLTAALEKLYRFDTGLTPPVTFTPNRRIGANGAYVVGFHAGLGSRSDFLESAQWIDVE